MNKIIWKRFEELEKTIEKIEATKVNKNVPTVISIMTGEHQTEIVTYVDDILLLQWRLQAEDLLSQITNEQSTYYKEFVEITNSEDGINYHNFQKLKTIFFTLKSDYKNGYLTSIKTLIQAEVFENQLEQSQELLDSNYILASAVVAGIVLETAMREICTRAGIEHGKLDKMNADLAKKGVYNKLQQKRITALADIRNSAAHGKECEFTKDDVKKMIRDIEDFLVKYLDDV